MQAATRTPARAVMEGIIADVGIRIERIVDGKALLHEIEGADDKLRWRATLPGAAVYDRAAHVARVVQSHGVDAHALLPLVLPASWMVNSKASSRVMKRWLSAPKLEAWAELLAVLPASMSPEDWLAGSAPVRGSVSRSAEALVVGAEAEGASLAALTKVLALLRPQLVPLMDDAALWFALELVPEPDTADCPTAPPSAFVPMLDWFAGQLLAAEGPLTELAARHDAAVLDAAQVLDRLLWMESWGNRHRAPPA